MIFVVGCSSAERLAVKLIEGGLSVVAYWDVDMPPEEVYETVLEADVIVLAYDSVEEHMVPATLGLALAMGKLVYVLDGLDVFDKIREICPLLALDGVAIFQRDYELVKAVVADHKEDSNL